MNFRLLLALSLIPGFTLKAQDEGPARTLKSRSISFQVDDAIPEIFAHSVTAKQDAPGVPVKVKSYLNHEVEALPMTGDRLVFTTSQDRSSMSEPKEVIAKVKVPEGVRSVVLMFLPGSGKPGAPKYRILPIEDTLRSFPRGSYKVINLSPVPVRLKLEKTDFVIRPKATELIEDPPVNARNSSAMYAFCWLNEQWQQIGASTWPHPGKKRVIHVAFYNPRSQKVELRGIRDIAVDDE